MSNCSKSQIALLIAFVLYGINYIVVKSIVPVYIPAKALAVVRMVPSTILFWLLCVCFKKDKLDKHDIPRLILGGLTGVVFNQLLFLWGMEYTSPIDASIIMTSNPLIVLLLSAMFLGEKIGLAKVVGIVVGACGAIMLVLSNGFTHELFVSTKGNLLILGNSLSFAFYLLIIKPIAHKYDPLVLLKWVFLFGTIIYIPFGWHYMLLVQWEAFTIKTSLSVLYIVFFTTVGTYALISYAQKHLKNTTISIYTYVQPVVATVLAIFLGMGQLTSIKVMASALVFVGVYLVSFNFKKT
jgi:drug/metabolite transporter (DMT)-like permease